MACDVPKCMLNIFLCYAKSLCYSISVCLRYANSLRFSISIYVRYADPLRYAVHICGSAFAINLKIALNYYTRLDVTNLISDSPHSHHFKNAAENMLQYYPGHTISDEARTQTNKVKMIIKIYKRTVVSSCVLTRLGSIALVPDGRREDP
jgi:hypothetical protein